MSIVNTVSGNVAGMTLNTVAVMSIQCLITILERQPKLIRLRTRPRPRPTCVAFFKDKGLRLGHPHV